jgi:hypothetical protein
MTDKMQCWQKTKWHNLPIVVVDCSDVYEKIVEEVTRHTYANAPTVASTIATIRTAWAFVGQANQCLPKVHRVYVHDPERAIDRVDDVFTALHMYAATQQCKLVTHGWTVWVGRPDVMLEWERKLR